MFSINAADIAFDGYPGVSDPWNMTFPYYVLNIDLIVNDYMPAVRKRASIRMLLSFAAAAELPVCITISPYGVLTNESKFSRYM